MCTHETYTHAHAKKYTYVVRVLLIFSSDKAVCKDPSTIKLQEEFVMDGHCAS